MKKALLIVGVTLALFAAGFVTYVATRPAEYHVERSRTIPASPEQLRPYFEDFQQWGEWNPWDGRDPEMTKEFSDPPHGEGAWYTWSGNEDVGTGKMTITEITPESVTYHLEFFEPFASEADTTITFAPAGDGTEVTWSMDGENDFMAKMVGVFMDFDAMIGGDFDQGLTNLDELATKGG